MEKAAKGQMDSEALIETKPADLDQQQERRPLWRVESLEAQVRTASPRALLCIFAGLVGTLLFVGVALIWILVGALPGARTDACESFFLNIEVGNVDNWVVPPGCGSFVETYVEKGQYQADFAAAVAHVRSHVESIGRPSSDGLDLWILDIDETSLSNVPFFEKHTHWGMDAWTDEIQQLWDTWVMEGTAQALTPTLDLYREMRNAGWQIAFITGRSESQHNITVEKMLAVGYSGWQSLTLRSPEEMDEPATSYKSRHRQTLISQGFRIHGGMGDQWSDLQGAASGNRTFKLPNPMYYVG